MSDLPPAGWYPSGDPGELRWWDGARWSDHRSAAGARTAPAGETGRLMATESWWGVGETTAAAAATGAGPHGLPPAPPAPSVVPAPRAADETSTGLDWHATVAAAVLIAWAAIGLLLAVFAHGPGGYVDPIRLFDGPHTGSAGLFGHFWYSWYDSSLGSPDLNLFMLALAGVGVAALVGLLGRHSAIRGAAFGAAGLTVMHVLIWLPFGGGVGMSDFLWIVIPAAIIPSVALVLALTSRTQWATPDPHRSASVGVSPAYPAPSAHMHGAAPAGPWAGPPVGVHPTHPQYGGYPYPAPYPSGRARTNGLAVAALITGLLGFSVLGIVFGHVALSQIRRSHGLEKGSGMATTGLLFSYLWLAATAGLIIWVLGAASGAGAF